METYSFLWGRRNAVLAWIGALGLTAAATLLAADQIGMALPVAGLLGLLLSAAAITAWCFLRHPVINRARLFERISGLWTLLMYLGLGAVPLLVRL